MEINLFVFLLISFSQSRFSRISLISLLTFNKAKMSKFEDLFGKKKESVPVLDLSKTTATTKEEFKKFMEKVPDPKIRPDKVRPEEIKIKEKELKNLNYQRKN